MSTSTPLTEEDDCGDCVVPNSPEWNAACTGCTDPNAVNYDPEATIPCTTVVEGGIEVQECCQYSDTIGNPEFPVVDAGGPVANLSTAIYSSAIQENGLDLDNIINKNVITAVYDVEGGAALYAIYENPRWTEKCQVTEFMQVQGVTGPKIIVDNAAANAEVVYNVDVTGSASITGNYENIAGLGSDAAPQLTYEGLQISNLFLMYQLFLMSSILDLIKN